MTVQTLSPATIRLDDLIDELGLDYQRVDNWVQRDQLPLPTEPRVRGRATRVQRPLADELAVFLVVASMIGPTRAIAACEDEDGFSSNLTVNFGCTTMRVDLVPIRAAVIRAEKSELLRLNAA
jgi:hypothetical protein